MDMQAKKCSFTATLHEDDGDDREEEDVLRLLKDATTHGGRAAYLEEEG